MLLCCSLLQACSALNLKLCERTTVRAIAASVGGEMQIAKNAKCKTKNSKVQKKCNLATS